MATSIEPPRGFSGGFLLDHDSRTRYSGASGILEARPRAVAVPDHASDVSALVAWAAATGTPLVPRGAATGMPGGNIGPGVAIDMVSGFQNIGGIDRSGKRVDAQPGVLLAALNSACASAGLQFPVDPSSAPRCSLGGMLANNSAGAHSVKYGATRGWVHAMDVVLADGSRARTERGTQPDEPALRRIVERIDALLRPRRDEIAARWPRVRKNSSGYALLEYLDSGDVIDLLVGSEGTLAITVNATLGLSEIPPRRGLALLEFTSLEAAGDAIRGILPRDPATCEMLDRTFLELIRDAGADDLYPLRPDLEAILLVEVEGRDLDDVDEKLHRIADSVRSTASRVALASDPALQRNYWAIRHAASPIIAQRAGRRVSMQFIEDTVVPVPDLPAYVRALRDILARHNLPAVIFGHAGDGNLHVNPLVDVADPDWRRVLATVLDEVAATVARFGGTLSGEHGDGRLRAPLLESIWGHETVALFRAVKDAFDPEGILNPGVIVPLPGQRPFERVREYS